MFLEKRHQAFLISIFYIGIAGAALLFAFSNEKIRGNLGAVVLHRDVPAYIGCIIEMILVFLIVVTVLTTIDPKNEFTGMSSPLAIGFASAVGMLMAVRQFQI